MSKNAVADLLAPLKAKLEGRPAEIAKAKSTSQKVVGYFCPHVPEELILAGGMIPLRLAFGGDPEATYAGEDFLKPDSCPYARACMGYKKLQNPYFEAVDALCVAYTCDSIRKNQEYWSQYYGIPAFPLGITQTHDRLRTKPQANDYFKKELDLLKKRLEEFSGNRISNSDLRRAIKLCNQIRDKLWLLFEYPADAGSPIEWKDIFQVAQAGFLLDRADFAVELDRILEELQRMPKKQPEVTAPARLMVCGSIIANNDTKVLELIRQAGGNIVADGVCTGSMFSRKRVTLFGVVGDPVEALAERYQYNVPCPFMTDLPKRKARMARIARDYKVQGVIYYNLKYCDTWRAEFNAIRQFLQKELSLPTLLIEAEYSPADIGTIKTKIEAFIEMIGGE